MSTPITPEIAKRARTQAYLTQRQFAAKNGKASRETDTEACRDIFMKKIAVLVVSILFYASVVPIVAETPEITEARLAGENDANGFNWKWFGMSYLISNASPLVFISAIQMIEEFNLDAGTLRTIDPRYCLAAYGIYALAPTVVAMTHSPASCRASIR